MADSPLKNSEGPAEISIKVAGADLSDLSSVAEVVVNKSINQIPTAVITLLDGSIPEQTFPISDKDDLAPGAKVEIGVRYGTGDESTVFEGIIVKHGISIGRANKSTLVIECKDAAVKMTLGRKNANFNKAKSGATAIEDKKVMAGIIGDYSDLTADVKSTTAKMDELVQYNSSDWDFLLSRAEANAMLVVVNDGKVTIEKPDLTTTEKITVTYGVDLLEFEANIDSSFQHTQVTSVAWDPSTLKVAKSVVKAESDSSARGTKNGDLSKVIGLADYKLQSQTPMVTDALKDWATSQQTKAELAVLRGFVRFQGNASVEVGKMIELANLGKRFDGNVFVSTVQHEIEKGNWVTEVEFGYTHDWFAERKDIVSPGAAGLVPAAEGLQIGIVKKLDEDPADQNRIQVSVPLLEAETEGVWARLGQFYASAGFGSFIIPEIGDEVILGYFNNDPSSPVILGSLYSKKNAPELKLTPDNYIKEFTTKEKLKLQFDDEKKIITIETPGGHSIVMDDDEPNIVITDSNDNVITMSKDGIDLTTKKDLTLNADGKITFTAKGNVETSATGDAKVEGMNVALEAKTALTAKGKASAEISASGQTTVKGAMVMIN